MPQNVLSRIAASLAEKFEGVFSVQTVERYVFESYTALHRMAKVHPHLTVLAQRFATDRLTALAQSQGDAPEDVPEVLFLCVRNAGRCQMAAALLSHRARGRVHVRSAGSTPTHSINPTVIEAMAEIGLDLARSSPSRSPTTLSLPRTVWSPWAAATPARSTPTSSTATGPWPTPDGADLATVRGIRDDLDTRVQVFLRELTTPTLSRSEFAASTATPHPA